MSDVLPRCRIIPLPHHQVAFTWDGQTRTVWHFGEDHPRPFFFPMRGPAGESLTRMGHPGAPNHDHHCSVWFAHNRVLGIDFWSDTSAARIRQRQWLAYDDGDDEARMGVELDWLDGHDPQPLLTQRLLVAAHPLEGEAWSLELQSEFRPQAAMLELGASNFGLLAVRVARSLSAVFGGGRLVDSEGRRGESAIFEQHARWVDYSGPVSSTSGGTSENGLAFIDHPGNPRYPNRWHVRDDGWMGLSTSAAEPLLLSRERPLPLRYLLFVHAGAAAPAQIEQVADEFARRPRMVLVERPAPHRHATIVRQP